MADAPGETGVLLYDGFDHGGGSELLDLWAYQPGTGWSKLGGALAPSGGDVFVYDRQSGRIILVTVSGETWAYDVATRRWEDRKAPGTPSLLGARGAYDSKADRLIVFGGWPGVYTAGNFRPGPLLTDQTWAYDYNANRWTQMHPQISPPARNFSAMAYDESSDRVIVFGGSAGGLATLGDTWAYDFNADAWRQMTPAAAPSDRAFSPMVYDAAKDRMVLFGGTDVGTGGGSARLHDTWTYDYDRNTWTELKITGPSDRAYHMMAYDAETANVVLFGGGPGPRAYTNEVWLFSSSKNAWAPG